jgi:hypothetical protein
MANIDMSLYEFTDEEKAYIAQQKELRKEKRKLFATTTIMQICAVTLLIFQMILVFQYGIFRDTQSVTSFMAYLISAIIAVPLTIFSIVPMILSIVTLTSTNKYIRIASIVYIVLSILIIILNLIYLIAIILKVTSIF